MGGTPLAHMAPVLALALALTLALYLTGIEYWDRAGGARNIV